MSLSFRPPPPPLTCDNASLRRFATGCPSSGGLICWSQLRAASGHSTRVPARVLNRPGESGDSGNSGTVHSAWSEARCTRMNECAHALESCAVGPTLRRSGLHLPHPANAWEPATHARSLASDRRPALVSFAPVQRYYRRTRIIYLARSGTVLASGERYCAFRRAVKAVPAAQYGHQTHRQAIDDHRHPPCPTTRPG
jgi:hypothetical protein